MKADSARKEPVVHPPVGNDTAILSPASFRQDNVGRLLLRSFRQFERLVIDELLKMDFDDIRPTHLSILTHIPPEGIRTSEIAALANMTKQAVGQVATQLEEMGYIARRPDPADGRARIVEFTNKGRRLCDETYHILAHCEECFGKLLGLENLATMKQDLRTIAERKDW